MIEWYSKNSFELRPSISINFWVSKQSGLIMLSLFLIAGNFSCKQANSFSGSSPNAPKKQKESVAVPTKSIAPTP
jgi:hypothetical protein